MHLHFRSPSTGAAALAAVLAVAPSLATLAAAQQLPPPKGPILDLPQDVLLGNAVAAFSADGSLVAMAASGLTSAKKSVSGPQFSYVVLLDLRKGAIRWTHAMPPGRAEAVRFVDGDRRVVVSSSNWLGTPAEARARIEMLDVSTGQSARVLLDAAGTTVRLLPAAAGELAAVVAKQGARSAAAKLTRWSTTDGKELSTLALPIAPWYCALSPNGDFLVYPSVKAEPFSPGSSGIRAMSTTVYVVRLPGLERVADLDVPSSGMTRWCFSPDGRSLVGIGDRLGTMSDIVGSEIVTWNAARWTQASRVTENAGPLRGFAYLPGGTRAVTFCQHGVTGWPQVRDTRTWASRQEMRTVTLQSDGIDVSPDGRTVLAAGRGQRDAAPDHSDGWYQPPSVSLWDIPSGDLVATLQVVPVLQGQNVTVEWLAFTADGTYDCSAGLLPYVRWGQGSEVLAAEATARTHRRPEVVRRALQRSVPVGQQGQRAGVGR